MLKNNFNRFVFWGGVLFLFCASFLFYYEKNPAVYNAFAQRGINLGFLDNLGSWEKEMACGTYFSLVDEDGCELEQISRFVFVGDEFILENNRHYQVIKVNAKENKAIAQFLDEVELVWQEEWATVPVTTMLAAESSQVGVYMTHTDESYIPTDGAESIPGNGGILKVGNVFSNNLKKKDVNVLISFNKHDPHDAKAYHRSRKTAVQLLKTNPLALVDVHRDGVPDPNFYQTTVKGMPGTKIRLVIGKQNPHMEANLTFAKNLKAYFDRTSPGLIKGIYMGKGNYNQDLGPRTILIEVGTYTNSRFAAERGVALFAEGIPRVLGAMTGPGTAPGVNKGLEKGMVSKSILGLFLVLVFGGAFFLWLSTGSWRSSWEKLTHLGEEFGLRDGRQKISVRSGKRDKRGNGEK